MKVKRKLIHALDDEFTATERGTRVSIRRYRSTVILDVLTKEGVTNQEEMTLDELAHRLLPKPAAR